MAGTTRTESTGSVQRRKWVAMAAILSGLLAAAIWVWHARDSAPVIREAGIVQVVGTDVTPNDVPIRLTANGTASALQSVEVRPQISATIKAVHIREGQFVHRGDKLFSLDARTEEANLSMNAAQLVKDSADLKNAERNLERQRALFEQAYISRAELETAQNQVAVLRGQLEVDSASVEASRVARSFAEITAPIAGRTGAVAVYPGSLVQPNGAALLSITQIDPINISFTLPERALPDLQLALSRGVVPVGAKLDLPGQPLLNGHLVFIDSAVDTASGSIRLKAEFPNPDNRLWPGMFVSVTLAPHTLVGALTVPVQAVQTGPENKFLYVIGADHKVTTQPVEVRLIQDGVAVIEGIAPGARIVVEGAQNLRPGSVVSEDGGQKTEDRQNRGNANPGAGEQ